MAHEYLWTFTPVYYFVAGLLYVVLRNRANIKRIGFIPSLALPATMDYLKRDYYVNLFPKEKKEIAKAKKMVKNATFRVLAKIRMKLVIFMSLGDKDSFLI